MVDDQALPDDRVWDDHHAVVPGTDARAAQPDIDDVPPGVEILNLDAVADPVRTINHDDKARNRIGQRLLSCQCDRQGPNT